MAFDNILCARITVGEFKAVEPLWLVYTQKSFRLLESFKKVEQSLEVYVDDKGCFDVVVDSSRRI